MYMRVIEECGHCGKGHLYPKSEVLPGNKGVLHYKYWDECDYCGHKTEERTTEVTITN